MKIIKALRSITVPVRGEKPSRFVMKQTYPPQELIVVHEETLKTLDPQSYAVYSGDKFVDAKAASETKKKKSTSKEKKTLLGFKKEEAKDEPKEEK